MRGGPSTAIAAGRNVIAARIATATTMIAPIAIERMVVESTRNSPASEIITVTPLNATARPEVRMAIRLASTGSAPSRTSSR